MTKHGSLPRPTLSHRLAEHVPPRLRYVKGLLSLSRLDISTDERAFVAKELGSADHMFAFICLLLGFFFHGVAAWFLTTDVVPAKAAPLYFTFHLTAVVGILLVLCVARHRLLFRWLSLVGYVGVISFLSWALATIDGIETSHALFLYALQIVLCIYFVLTFPFSVPGCVPFTAFGMLAAWIGIHRFPEITNWALSGIALQGTICITKLWDVLGTIERSLIDVRQRFALAPAEIVRSAIESDERLEDLFKPSLRRCICLSSDWRSYQVLSKQIPAGELEAMLSEYYAEVGKILSATLIKGNYFSDWIADELFLVTYNDNVVEISGQLMQLLDACHEILRQKKRIFSGLTTVPGIDIGLSLGEAYVGMMGPPGHRKATALGTIPGRARRMQSVGKILRHHFGPMDRIIFGADVLQAIRHSVTVQEVRLSPATRLRDLDDKTLFVSSPWCSDDMMNAALWINEDAIDEGSGHLLAKNAAPSVVAETFNNPMSVL